MLRGKGGHKVWHHWSAPKVRVEPQEVRPPVQSQGRENYWEAQIWVEWELVSRQRTSWARGRLGAVGWMSKDPSLILAATSKQ